MDIISRILINANEMDSDDVFYHVATGILHNIEEIPYMTVAEMAELCGVSQPTVSRFIRYIGCANSQNFKMELAIALNTHEAGLPERERFSWDSDDAALTGLLSESLASLRPQLPGCAEIAAQLRQAKNVLFLFGNIDPVLTLQRRLCIEGKQVFQARKPKVNLADLTRLGAGDFLFTTVSDPWELTYKQPLAQTVMSRGARVVLLTTQPAAVDAMLPTFAFRLNGENSLLARIQAEFLFAEITQQYLTS